MQKNTIFYMFLTNFDRFLLFFSYFNPIFLVFFVYILFLYYENIYKYRIVLNFLLRIGLLLFVQHQLIIVMRIMIFLLLFYDVAL